MDSRSLRRRDGEHTERRTTRACRRPLDSRLQRADSGRAPCDILVNNVGIYGPQDFFDIPDSEWTRFFELNVMSGVRLSRAYMSGMLERLQSSPGWPRGPSGDVMKLVPELEVIRRTAAVERLRNAGKRVAK